MNKLKLKTITLMLSIPFLLSSCAKKGCTDKNASNYESAATRDDGTCTYKGTVVFWYNKATAENLISVGSTALKYYVDGILVGSSAASIYWTGAPSCGQNQSITIEKDLGFIKSKGFNYKVIDQDNDVIWSGTIDFTANTCTKLELN